MLCVCVCTHVCVPVCLTHGCVDGPVDLAADVSITRLLRLLHPAGRQTGSEVRRCECGCAVACCKTMPGWQLFKKLPQDNVLCMPETAYGGVRRQLTLQCWRNYNYAKRFSPEPDVPVWLLLVFEHIHSGWSLLRLRAVVEGR